MSIRYQRFASALGAAAVYNVNRASTDDPIVTAFDFVRDEKSALRRERTREAKRHIMQMIGQLPMTTPLAKFHDTRRKVIADLLTGGVTNAEQLFDECWPSLKPKEGAEHV